jgi:hypothetical protein
MGRRTKKGTLWARAVRRSLSHMAACLTDDGRPLLPLLNITVKRELYIVLRGEKK